jgi:two-component system chemotaxis response regulator CheY
MNIIIAHEDIIVRKKLRQALEKLNMEIVAEASNGLQAYNKYVEHRAELIFLHLNLPIYDGNSALNRIKIYEPNAICVMMGGHFQNRELFKALEDGATHYLELPIEEENVKRTIKEIMLIANEME